MGIIRLPELEDYWKTSWVAAIPFFSRVLARDRFESIFWMLHVSHSTGQVLKKINKVQLFLDKIGQIVSSTATSYPGVYLA